MQQEVAVIWKFVLAGVSFLLGVVLAALVVLKRRGCLVRAPLGLGLGRVLRELCWVFVPLMVLGTFYTMTMIGSPSISRHEGIVAYGKHSILVRSTTGELMALDLEATGTGTSSWKRVRLSEADHNPEATVASTTMDADRTMVKRPDWIDQPRTIDGDCERVVIESHQYSTREEAERELLSAALLLVQQDLAKLQPGKWPPPDWSPPAEAVVAHAVKQQYEEVVERDFGSFSHPMHRVWWQIELSPTVRTEFLPAWRHAFVSQRIAILAAVASILVMIVTSGVIYFRLNSLTGGAARGMMKLLSVTMLAMWIVGSLYVARHG